MNNFFDKFKLNAEKEKLQTVVENIDNGVVFCGTNLWVLIFAILVASLGLNVNSTAVIIGTMYDLSTYPTDHPFWEFLALTTGTGGCAIIIGSAAGVAVMGIEHIDFMWYLKKISWLALIGFVAGILVFLLQMQFT